MGQNRRYDLVGRDLERRDAVEARRPIPLGLGPEEVRSSGRREDAREPVAVTAWVEHQISYAEPRFVDAEAIAWTPRAVLLRWTPEGERHPIYRWVWASAVQRR